MRKPVVLLAVVAIMIGAAVVLYGGLPTPTPQLPTATVKRADVVVAAVATGSIAPRSTYGLAFGTAPQLIATSTAPAPAGPAGIIWPVTSLSVAVGDRVTQGQPLAAADPTFAQRASDLAVANLAVAQAKLATDQAGVSPSVRAAAQDSVNQAQVLLSTAQGNLKDTQVQDRVANENAQAALVAARALGNAFVIANAKIALKAARARGVAAEHTAQSRVDSAQAALDAARHTYDIKVGPTAEATIAADNLAVATAQAAVSNAAAALSAATLTAPSAGVITDVNIETGANAPAGYAITLTALPLQVIANFDEVDVASLTTGEPGTITVRATGAVVNVTVATIAPLPAAGAGVVTYPVTLSLVNPPDALRVGQSVQVSIPTGRASSVLTLPTIALHGKSGAYTVSLIGADGRPHEAAVTTGLVSPALAEIKDGVSLGDKVALASPAANP